MHEGVEARMMAGDAVTLGVDTLTGLRLFFDVGIDTLACLAL